MNTPDVIEQPKAPTPVACSDLLACPFCGELPEYEPWAQGHAPEYHWPHQIVHNCKIIGDQICVRSHNVGLPDTKDSVFSIWNTRAAGQANDDALCRPAGDAGGAQGNQSKSL